MKKLLTFLISAAISTSVFAHDEGHGPKLGDQPRYGGSVAAVIKYDDVEKGREAELLYKAELTKNAQGVVRIYFYDKDMKPIDLSKFENASAKLQYRDSTSRKRTSKNFSLEKKDSHFEGKLPISPRPPFNVDVTVQSKDQKLFMAFDNLS